MKKLGLTIIFSIMSVFTISAMEMENYGPETAVSEDMMEQMKQQAYAERLRRINEEQRQQREAREREYRQRMREGMQNAPNRPVRKRLFQEDVD